MIKYIILGLAGFFLYLYHQTKDLAYLIDSHAATIVAGLIFCKDRIIAEIRKKK